MLENFDKSMNYCMWILVLTLGGLVRQSAIAADEDEEKAPMSPRRGPTEEQQAVRREMLEKYDKNKNGKIDADERLRITPADKAKLARVNLGEYVPRRRREDPTPATPRAPSPPPAQRTPKK
jgi:hypothetical protein